LFLGAKSILIVHADVTTDERPGHRQFSSDAFDQRKA
jgi:hypothetical protein